jgi:hypothetical protein
MVIKLIEAGEFEAYPDALRFLLAVRDAGIPVAAASSSKLLAAANANLVVTSLDEVDMASLGKHQLRRRTIESLTE